MTTAKFNVLNCYSSKHGDKLVDAWVHDDLISVVISGVEHQDGVREYNVTAVGNHLFHFVVNTKPRTSDDIVTKTQKQELQKIAEPDAEIAFATCRDRNWQPPTLLQGLDN